MWMFSCHYQNACFPWRIYYMFAYLHPLPAILISTKGEIYTLRGRVYILSNSGGVFHSNYILFLLPPSLVDALSSSKRGRMWNLDLQVIKLNIYNVDDDNARRTICAYNVLAEKDSRWKCLYNQILCSQKSWSLFEERCESFPGLVCRSVWVN